MKRLCLAGGFTALLLAVGVYSLVAQEKAGKPTASKGAKGKKAPGEGMPPYLAQVGLNEQQREKVEGILGEYRPKIEALETQLDQLRSDREKALRSALTAQQRQRWDELIAEGQRKRQQGDKRKVQSPDASK